MVFSIRATKLLLPSIKEVNENKSKVDGEGKFFPVGCLTALAPFEIFYEFCNKI